jgi:xylose isomerase
MPGGYHDDVADETPEERAERAAGSVGPLVDGFEFHYPGEIDEQNATRIVKILDAYDKDVYAVALGLFCDPRFGLGSFIHPDPAIRNETVDITKRAIRLAAQLKAKLIIWPGGEGYNYPFQIDYADAWDWFITGIAASVDYANGHGVPVLLEHKNSEPAMKILMRDLGMSMFVVHKVAERGVDISNLKLNMDWQHLIMNGEPLAEYAVILEQEGLLGHQHANSGWGQFDDDNIVGASFFMQTLALAKELQRMDYGKNGERMGFDLFPYTEDQAEAVRRSVLHWEFISDLARKIDDEALSAARASKDALGAYREVYKALGLDDAYERRITGRYRP